MPWPVGPVDKRPKLDSLAPPDDSTRLDANQHRHGLMPKLSGNANEFVNGAGGFSSPGSGGALSVTDSMFTIADDADPSKLLQFQCSGISAGTTRTVTARDASGTMALTDVANTFTKAQTLDNDTASDVPFSIIPHAAQSAEMWRVRDATNSYNRVYVSSSGIFTLRDVWDLEDAAFSGFVCDFVPSGGWAGTQSIIIPTLDIPGLQDTMAVLGSTQTFTGDCTFGGVGSTTILGVPGVSDIIRVGVNPGSSFTGTGFVLDDGSGFLGEVTAGSSGLTANRVWTFPDSSGTILVNPLGTSVSALTDTASSGFSFRDTTTSSRRLRMVLSGAVGNNSFTFTNSAARNYGFGNLSGNVVIVGDDPPAVASGALGKVDLTGQTAAIGSTNLSNTPPAGLYRVDVYVACTTASGSGAPTLDVNIAWTDVVGATNVNVTAEDGGATAFPLSLAATGRSRASVLCQVASGNISYSTTINAASGSPQYAIYIRVTQLG